MTNNKTPNRLINEKSPYLLQHAYNPVDWYAWGEDAFQKAQKENKVIFLSIGYSTCHWCHVMERECFEDDQVAEILNQNFVSIKVDREERPDIDHIYMSVCQAITNSGGWPLTIFMTPDKKPFYAGTYFPKTDRMGMPGFITLLNRIASVWDNDRDALIRSGTQITNIINTADKYENSEVTSEIMHKAFLSYRYDFDSEYGGFGHAPKFPSPHNLFFLLRYWYITKENLALEMVEKTLDSMYRGGIYDHIGFGFCRYSTDQRWLQPHFEKMLYDNALLSIAYLEAYQVTKKEKYANAARQIFTYILRDMTSPEGGFYSAEDADSEGQEGKFYVWTVDEIKQVLGDNAGQMFCEYYDITQNGNFDGSNIPNLINSSIPQDKIDIMQRCRQNLFEYREKRVHPYKDDKILTGWNGLMIAAMAIGGKILGEKQYTLAAEKAYAFIDTNLIRDDGRLLARYRDKQAAYLAYADDYTFLTLGLLELYETTYKPEYLIKAVKINDDLIKLFWDDENGGLFIYGSDGEQLITRPKEIYDGATPSANSVAAMNFQRLARLTASSKLESIADRQLKTFAGAVSAVPRGYAFFLISLLFALTPTTQVVIAGGHAQMQENAMLDIISNDFKPFMVSILYDESKNEIKAVAPFLEKYKAIDGKPTAYVCENFACQPPVTNADQLKEILKN